MNNNMKKIMALALAAAMTLSACGTATTPAEKPYPVILHNGFLELRQYQT